MRSFVDASLDLDGAGYLDWLQVPGAGGYIVYYDTADFGVLEIVLILFPRMN